jgi:gliding motility-associated-like protein
MILSRKYILSFTLLLLLLSSYSLSAQVIDKVCPSVPYGNYGVKGSPGSAFFWQVIGGQIIQSNGVDSIQVQWDFTQAEFKLQVVEISKNGCVGDTIRAEVDKGQDPIIYINGQDSLCLGSRSLMTAQGGLDYLWSTGDQNPTIAASILGDTTFFVIGDDGCGFDTASLNVKALPNPVADFDYAPQEVFDNQDVIFTFTGNGGWQYQWYFDNSLLNNDNSEVTYSFNSTGQHEVFLLVRSEFQCIDTISKAVFVKPSRFNTFTPDGDGVNDTWVLEELRNYPNCRVWIFDRSGAEVFFSEGYLEPWDGMRNGKYLPQGTYYYVIDFGVDNQTSKGTVTILR